MRYLVGLLPVGGLFGRCLWFAVGEGVIVLSVVCFMHTYLAPEAYERTIYTACWNATRGVYYYTGYHRHRISAVKLWNENPDGTRVVCYPMLCGEDVFYQNRTE